MTNYTIGRHSYSYAIHRGNANSVSIGNYTSVAENVIFDRGFNHFTDRITTFPLNKIWSELPSNIDVRGDISIGSDCWIGEGAVIMSGIKICDGAIVGCNAVVTKDVEPYAVVGGVPAKVIRYRFAPEHIEKLLILKWWEWSDEKIKENVPLFQSDNLGLFLHKHAV